MREFINRKDFANITYLLRGHIDRLEKELEERKAFDPSSSSVKNAHLMNDIAMAAELVHKIDRFTGEAK